MFATFSNRDRVCERLHLKSVCGCSSLQSLATVQESAKIQLHVKKT
jgi:hypothetical protein